MSVSKRLAELEAERADEERDSPFSAFNQRAIVKMAIHPHARKYVEPAMPHLDWGMFDDVVTKCCFSEIKAFWEEHGCFPTGDKAVDLLDELKKAVTTDDADFGEFIALFREELDPSDVRAVRASLDGWVRRKLYARAVASEEAIAALGRGDYDTIRKLFADAEGSAASERDEVLDFLASPEQFLKPDSVEHLVLSVPTLSRTLGTGGPCRGEVLCYLGRTGMGKSIALANDAVGSALAGQKTLLVTFEISRVRMAQRCASILTGVDTDQLANHAGSVARQCRAQMERLGASTLKIVHLSPARWSVNKVRALIQKFEQDEGWSPDVVVLDYMELMVPRSKSARQESEYLRQKEVATDLSFLASDQGVLVVSATQANREGVKNESNVGLQHIAESYGKAMNMDYIVSLNQTREEREELPPTMRLSIIKNREGECRTVPVAINYRTKKITEIP